jgi:transposase
VVTPQDLLPDGITRAQFQVDAEKNIIICPQGHTASNPDPVGNSLRFQFPKKICDACPLHSRCCTGKSGRTIGISSNYELVQRARQRQKTDDFKQDYHKHRSGVEETLSALVRGNGMRVGRYIGQKKHHLQTMFTGCAANLKHTALWLAGVRPQQRTKSWTLHPA